MTCSVVDCSSSSFHVCLLSAHQEGLDQRVRFRRGPLVRRGRRDGALCDARRCRLGVTRPLEGHTHLRGCRLAGPRQLRLGLLCLVLRSRHTQ